jgi:molecular chaperone DnaK
MIKRNTTVPCEVTEVFSTAEDDQKKVDVRVYQGERPRASQNRFLGEFHLEGLPPAPRGIPQIEVKFSINSNGILSVTARDRVTEVEQTVTMTGSSSLTSDEITKMISDAAEHEAEDAQFEETVAAQDNLRSKLFQIESLLREHRDLFDAELIENLEDGKASLEDILKSPASLEAMVSMSQAITATIKVADKIAQEAVAKEVEEAKNAN